MGVDQTYTLEIEVCCQVLNDKLILRRKNIEDSRRHEEWRISYVV